MTDKNFKITSINNAITLLPKLIEGYKWGNKQRIEKYGIEIAEILEDFYPNISKTIKNSLGQQPNILLKLGQKIESLLTMLDPRLSLDDVVINKTTKNEIFEVINEFSKREQLFSFQLQPRHKILLYGPPGNGKTMLAEALAYSLNVPFFCVKYSGLIDSYMGNTGKRLEEIMEYASISNCVLFIDEFDCIGVHRHNHGDVGEMRRITNQLLILLDKLPSTCMFIGATNAISLVDDALKRRFDFCIEIPDPTYELKLLCAQKELSVEKTPGHNVQYLAEHVAKMSFVSMYEVVEHCKKIRRDIVLNNFKNVERLKGDCL